MHDDHCSLACLKRCYMMAFWIDACETLVVSVWNGSLFRMTLDCRFSLLLVPLVQLSLLTMLLKCASGFGNVVRGTAARVSAIAVTCAGFLLRCATWLILPVVICLSQRLSHACASMN
jgi:hypothetical protein